MQYTSPERPAYLHRFNDCWRFVLSPHGTVHGMCRSIKTLRQPEQTASDDDVRAAALQYVRKVNGFRQPSCANAAAFDAAVEEVASASRRLLDALPAARAVTRMRLE